MAISLKIVLRGAIALKGRKVVHRWVKTRRRSDEGLGNACDTLLRRRPFSNLKLSVA